MEIVVDLDHHRDAVRLQCPHQLDPVAMQGPLEHDDVGVDVLSEADDRRTEGGVLPVRLVLVVERQADLLAGSGEGERQG